MNIKASLKYAHVFNNAHDVNVMFLYNRQSTTNEKDAAVPNNFEGYTMQLGYKYKNKYKYIDNYLTSGIILTEFIVKEISI